MDVLHLFLSLRSFPDTFLNFPWLDVLQRDKYHVPALQSSLHRRSTITKVNIFYCRLLVLHCSFSVRETNTKLTRVSKKTNDGGSRFFTGCSSHETFADPTLCTVEIFLVISLRYSSSQHNKVCTPGQPLSVLFLQQFWDYLALGRRYFRELESWFKLCIISLALTAMLFMENLVGHS